MCYLWIISFCFDAGTKQCWWLIMFVLACGHVRWWWRSEDSTGCQALFFSGYFHCPRGTITIRCKLIFMWCRVSTSIWKNVTMPAPWVKSNHTGYTVILKISTLQETHLVIIILITIKNNQPRLCMHQPSNCFFVFFLSVTAWIVPKSILWQFLKAVMFACEVRYKVCFWMTGMDFVIYTVLLSLLLFCSICCTFLFSYCSFESLDECNIG